MLFLLYPRFYSLIDDDPKSVNAFRVWRRNFPEEETAIAAVEAQVRPLAADLKRFRNRLGFHGSRSRTHEAPGFALFTNHSGTTIWKAMRNFKHLGAALLDKDMERQKAKKTGGESAEGQDRSH